MAITKEEVLNLIEDEFDVRAFCEHIYDSLQQAQQEAPGAEEYDISPLTLRKLPSEASSISLAYMMLLTMRRLPIGSRLHGSQRRMMMESIVEVVGIVIAIDPPMNEDKTGVISPEVEYWEALTSDLLDNPAVNCVHKCQPSTGTWIIECYLGDSLQRLLWFTVFCKPPSEASREDGTENGGIEVLLQGYL